MAMVAIGQDTPVKVLESVFKSFDADKNGTLDKDEFDALLSAIGIYDADAKFACQALADENADGVVSLQEFIVWCKADGIKDLIGNSHKFKMLLNISNKFKSIDVDGGNTIDFEEFSAFMVQESQSTVEEVQILWQELDDNGDGAITFKEYWNWYKQWLPPPPPTPQKKTYAQAQTQSKAKKEAATPPQKSAQAKPLAGGVSAKESLLNDTDFMQMFGMDKNAFYGLKGWKQKQLKKEKGFF